MKQEKTFKETIDERPRGRVEHWRVVNVFLVLYDIIAVNTATFVGKKVAGVPGGIVASLGVVAPSVVIITLIAGILTSFADIPAVKSAFGGIRVCVCVLIFNSVLKLFKAAVIDKAALVIFALVLACSFFFGVSPVLLVIFSAVAGIILTNLGVKGK